MRYNFECDDWGASFKVPASVVNDYIKLSDGNYIKILLCILSGNRCTDSQILSKRSGLSEEIVEDAVIYWKNVGVLSTKECQNNPEQGKEEKPVSVVKSINPNKKKAASKFSVSYSTTELHEKVENDENLKQLVNDIQKSLQFSINARELASLIELYEFYHFDVKTILLVSEYCVSQGKYSIAYLYSIMKRWYEEGFIDYSDIEGKIIQTMKYHSFEGKVLEIFGMRSKPAKKQREMIEKWDKMGVSIELVEIAYEKCMNAIKELSFDYINKILTSWVDGKITTVEEVEIDDLNFRKNKANKHNIEKNKDESSSYNLDEFEEYALNLGLDTKNF